MLLLVGLGNPGSEHARNRHNVGFMALDAIIERHGFTSPRSRFRAQVSEGQLAGTKVIALKPQTFMNESGRSVGEAARFYKIAPADIIVFYDEIDLAPGKVRVKSGGGTAGHNGIRSIDAHLGDPAYRRVRIGVGHPGHRDRVHGHVLGNFSRSDQDWLVPELDAIAEFVPLLVEGKDGDFMSKVVQAVSPKQPKSARKKDTTAPAEDIKSPSQAGVETDGNRAQTALGAALDKAFARFRGGTR